MICMSTSYVVSVYSANEFSIHLDPGQRGIVLGLGVPWLCSQHVGPAQGVSWVCFLRSALLLILGIPRVS